MKQPRSRDRLRPAPLSLEAFQAAAGFGDEARARLETFADLLRSSSARTSLVSESSLGDLWRRHFFDSAQLFPLVPPDAKILLDLGSGAGFPGLVVAMLARAQGRSLEVHLVESNARRVAFLREVNRRTNAGAIIHDSRIEAMEPFAADVATARALAPLERLLGLAAPFLGPSSVCFFLKGQGVDKELTATYKIWKMDVDKIPSRSDPTGRILVLRNVARRHAR